jgi:hypothetical protein
MKLKFKDGVTRFGKYELHDWDYRHGKYVIRACLKAREGRATATHCFTGKGSTRTRAARRAVQKFSRGALLRALAKCRRGVR